METGTTVNTVEDLILFVETYFDELNNEQWNNLLIKTLRIYPFSKPSCQNDAIAMIEKYSSIPIDTRPLFPDIE